VKEKTVILGFSIHFPLGSEPSDVERSYQERVRPLLSRIYANPSVPAALHLSGTALTALDSAHPEIVMLIKELARRKQVEIVSGGYSHPHFPLVPLADRLGQIEQATTIIRQAFDKRPRGCLLPLMLWEPQLASTLNAAGIDYTFLDEGLFLAAGCDPRLPQVTEDQGRSVTVFPAKRNFSVPLDAEPAVFARSIAADFPSGKGVLAYFIEPCSIEGEGAGAEFESRIERLFKSLASIQDEALLTLPSRHLRADAERGRAYFADPGARSSLVLKDGSSRLYGKTYFVHGLVNQLRGDKARKKAARELVWRAQGHEAYPGNRSSVNADTVAWKARAAAYRALIEAELITREKGVFMPSLVPIDYDFDGYDEFLFQGADMDAYVHRSGGIVVELDVLQSYANVLNLRTGPGEGPGVLFEDEIETADGKASTSAAGPVFSVESFESSRSDLKLVKEWTLPSFAPIRLEKRYSFKRNGVFLTASLVNIGTARITGRYANRSAFATRLREGQASAVTAKSEGSEALITCPGFQRLKGVDCISVSDAKGKPLAESCAEGKPSCDLSISETGDARLAYAWKFSLEPGERFEASMQFLLHPRRARGAEAGGGGA
jgi:hypothetical protein